MSDLYFTKSRLRSITFASDIAPRKIKKNINVRGYVRNGKFVRSFKREQDIREIAVKVAAVSLGVLGAVLGVGIASAAMTKVRYNKNLVDFGKKMANNLDDIPDMKIPKGVKNVVIPKETNKQSMSFFIGGLGTAEDVTGEKFLKTVRSAYTNQSKSIPKNMRKTPLEDRHELVPLFHSSQVRKSEIVNTRQDIYDAFKTGAIKGYNEDSVSMAKEIYKWHTLNPDKPINIITSSSGGFQGRDIPHILQAAGVDTKKLMKVFNTATPDYGLVDEIVPTMKVMHNDDLYAKTFPNLREKAGLPSLFRGNTIFLGNGDTPRYRELVERKAIFDAKSEVTRQGDKFIVGKPKIPTDWEMPLAVHLTPAYFNGETPTSKKTLQYLNNFMFKD